MATIGTFTRDKTGYSGAIRTLTVNIKARFVPNDARKSESAPDYRIFSGQAELGAAWKQRSSGETPRDYLSVVLDDPCFAEPVRVALFDDGKGSARLVWNRREG